MKVQSELQSPYSGPSSAFHRNVQGVIARVELTDGNRMYADVRLLTRRDLVLETSALPQRLRRGEVVEVRLLADGDPTEVVIRRGVVHWKQATRGVYLTALFLDEDTTDSLMDRVWDDRRNEIRYPSSVQVRVQVDEQKLVTGRLTNYSLCGMAVHTKEPLEIGDTHTVQVNRSNSPLEISATCQWRVETGYGYINGCRLNDNEGVILAERDLESSIVPWELSKSPETNGPANASPAGRFLSQRTARYNARAESWLARGDSFIHRIATLLLSGTLLALAVGGSNSQFTLLAGLVGITSYIGLSWESWRQREQASESRAVSLARLKRHVAEPSDIEISAESAAAIQEDRI